MAARATVNLRSVASPAPLAGTGPDRQDFVTGGDQLIVCGTDTIVRILLQPDDYVFASTTSPSIAMDIKNSSDPSSVIITVTPGGGTEDIVARVIERVAGVDNDFTKTRSIHIRAYGTDPDNPSTIQALLTMGNPASTGINRLIVPLHFNSADIADSTRDTAAIIAIPAGITYSDTYPLRLTILAALNVTVVLTLLGN